MLAYCLMPNHVHLIAIPERPNAMANALRATHANYARHYNLEKRSCGHVCWGLTQLIQWLWLH